MRERIETALLGLYACVDDLLDVRERTLGEDVISAWIQAEEIGDRLTRKELRAMVVGLVFAGNDTARNQLGLAVHAFVEHPAQWEQVLLLVANCVLELELLAEPTWRPALGITGLHTLPIRFRVSDASLKPRYCRT